MRICRPRFFVVVLANCTCIKDPILETKVTLASSKLILARTPNYFAHFEQDVFYFTSTKKSTKKYVVHLLFQVKPMVHCHWPETFRSQTVNPYL